MCDRRDGNATTRRPRWATLYAIVLGAAALYVVDVVAFATPARTVLACALAAGAVAATFGWIAQNRVALDQADWCDCASETVRIRVIHAPPVVPSPSRRPPIPVAREDAAGLVGTPR